MLTWNGRGPPFRVAVYILSAFACFGFFAVLLNVPSAALCVIDSASVDPLLNGYKRVSTTLKHFVLRTCDIVDLNYACPTPQTCFFELDLTAIKSRKKNLSNLSSLRFFILSVSFFLYAPFCTTGPHNKKESCLRR